MISDDLQIIRSGLPAATKPKHVVVIGAGMAGLSAASLLKQAGHHVTILEGIDRIGGRIFTLRKPFTKGNYLEGGAMRIPSSHKCVLEYINKFRLPVEKFYNDTPNDIYYANGVMTRAYYYDRHPDVLQFPVSPAEKGKTVLELIKWCEEPIQRIMRYGTPGQKQNLAKTLSQQSFMDFYRKNRFHRSLSFPAVEMIETILPIQGMPYVSMLEIMHNLYKYFLDTKFVWYAISGGNDQLPFSFYPELKENLFLKRKVKKIIPRDKSVSVEYTDFDNGKRGKEEADYLLTTAPFVAMKNIEIDPPTAFSYKKRRAIMSLNYEKAIKIGLEFRTHFWEKDGMFGGKTVTDGPTRYTFYPSNQYNNVLMASYTWGTDIISWEGLSETQRTELCLRFLAKIHGPVVYREFVTGGAYLGVEESMGGGDFSLFKPYQHLEFGEAIPEPEGRVHFAGEHTSEYLHGWIEGAVQSGIRAAKEINNRSFQE